MDTPDVKPELSVLKRGTSTQANNQPANKLRRSDNHSEKDRGVNSPSFGIKIEPNETGQTLDQRQSHVPIQFPSSASVNIKQENTSSEEILTGNENMKGQVEGTPAQRRESSYFSLASKERVHCIFPGCKVICLGQEAMERHFNMRHVTINLNKSEPTATNHDNNNYDNDFPSLSLSSSLPKPREKTNNHNNIYYNSTATSSYAISSKGHPSKFTCEVSECGRRCRTFEVLYKHQLRIHNLIPPLNTIKTFTCTDPDCFKVFVDEMEMKLHVERVHGPLIVTSVNSTDKEFKCPVPSCPSKVTTFRRLEELESHCFMYHSGHTFPWCSSDKNMKCPFPGCSRKFNRQTSLESHMMAKHGGKNPPSSSFSSPPRSTTIPATTSSPSTFESAAIEIEENQQVFKCMFANCSFSTADLDSFEHHQRLHTGDIPRFRCNFEDCETSFIDEAVMIEHRKVIHGIQSFD